ncbi:MULTISPECIES: beta-mannanase [Saccharibacillus]|uniref:Beta-mannanase n=1 Tax=Saccharibacillus brassicae TaxID=2583377 RepID=A0A4Y6UV58_SACBS|nr:MULTISPECIES: beta-mannanase [Saccharibacillus]MWJ31927.1 beta-mannanase [Saccharibacillus sp. WB 17]QDH21599.1 beta-mannanase [Saccharibacillus brassicae]
MRFIEAGPDSPVIRELTRRVSGDVCTLQWQWPSGTDSVYIGRRALDAEQAGGGSPADFGPGGGFDASGLKLYTREEYKAAAGYRDRLDGIGRFVYMVYAALPGSGEPVLVRQPDGSNLVETPAGRAKIRYSVRERKALFRAYKTVRIEISCEVPLDENVLCYVKKSGGYPVGPQDGTVYPFSAPFPAGRTGLPEIEVGKNDFVRVFFTDGKRYGQLYELVPE